MTLASARDCGRPFRVAEGTWSSSNPGVWTQQCRSLALLSESTTLAESVPFQPQHHDPRALRTGLLVEYDRARDDGGLPQGELSGLAGDGGGLGP